VQAAGGEVDVRDGQGGAATCEVSNVVHSTVSRVCEHSWPLASIPKVLASLRSFQL